MDFPDPKKLKKLADACRKAGILHFKSQDFEFTLSEKLPETKKNKQSPMFLPTGEEQDIETDSLTDEQLLFYSVGIENQFGGTGSDS